MIVTFISSSRPIFTLSWLKNLFTEASGMWKRDIYLFAHGGDHAGGIHRWWWAPIHWQMGTTISWDPKNSYLAYSQVASILVLCSPEDSATWIREVFPCLTTRLSYPTNLFVHQQKSSLTPNRLTWQCFPQTASVQPLWTQLLIFGLSDLSTTTDKLKREKKSHNSLGLRLKSQVV